MHSQLKHSKPILGIFLSLLLLHALALLLQAFLLVTITKPLLLPVLIAYALIQPSNGLLKKLLIAALFFSWLGDILLMFQQDETIFFLLGLGSFLIAHIFYILLFHRMRLNENIQRHAWLLIPVAIFYSALIWLLKPFLGSMNIPVRLYAVVISFMWLMAMHLAYQSDKKTGYALLAGASLFVVSDSILAINKFYYSFQTAGFFVMLIYGLAQLFLTWGTCRYLQKK